MTDDDTTKTVSGTEEKTVETAPQGQDQDTGAEAKAPGEVAGDGERRLPAIFPGARVTLGDEHPIHRLERAAAEYAKCAIGARGADARAANYTDARGARAQVLASRARSRKIDASSRLQAAAMLFAAWATERGGSR